MTTTTKDTRKPGEQSGPCHIDIRIESQGDVNIYNCTAPALNKYSTRPNSAMWTPAMSAI